MKGISPSSDRLTDQQNPNEIYLYLLTYIPWIDLILREYEVSQEYLMSKAENILLNRVCLFVCPFHFVLACWFTDWREGKYIKLLRMFVICKRGQMVLILLCMARQYTRHRLLCFELIFIEFDVYTDNNCYIIVDVYR